MGEPDLGLIGACKRPADVACSISYVGANGKVALTLVINQSCQDVWHHLRHFVLNFFSPKSFSLSVSLRKNSPLVVCVEGGVHACRVLQEQGNPHARLRLSLVERTVQADCQLPMHKITTTIIFTTKIEVCEWNLGSVMK